MVERRQDIEFQHLSCFASAAEHGSFRKQAQLSAFRNSRRIRDLEDCLGASLFHRHSGGVRLTNAGKRFLPRARKVIRNLHEGKGDVGQIGLLKQGCVRIGIYSSLASGFLTALLRIFKKVYCDVRIELIDGNPNEHAAAIRNLGLDIAFLTGSRVWPDCDSLRLWSEGVFVVIPKDNPLAVREELAWRVLQMNGSSLLRLRRAKKFMIILSVESPTSVDFSMSKCTP